jgi:hypothetical protein
MAGLWHHAGDPEKTDEDKPDTVHQALRHKSS